MKPYAEQGTQFDNGRGRRFLIRLFCQGTYDFTVTDYQGNPINQVTAMDVHFVHEKVREMRGWEQPAASSKEVS